MPVPWAALAVAAAGQAVSTDRPVVPSAGLAAEGSAGALWVNPANLAFDPDLRYGVFVGYDTADSLTSLAATAGMGALSIGAHHVTLPEGGDWSLDYATSFALPRRVAVGLRLGWHLVDDGTNYVAYDLGASWRPLPWFGAAAVAQNVGSASPRSAARSGAGLAFRPLGRFVLIGFDWAHQFAAADEAGTQVAAEAETLRVSGRMRPVEGLYVRGHAESRRNAELDTRGFGWGIGLEAYLSGIGAGAHAATDRAPFLDDLGMTLSFGTDEPGESLVRGRNRVPVLSLVNTPAYRPVAGFLESPPASWLETLELLRTLEEDDATRVLVVRLGGAALPWALAEEIRDRMVRLEASGTRVVAYLHEGASTTDYFVATGASTIALHPSQPLGVTGVSTELVHVRGLLDLVGVEPDFVKAGAYKSAPETFTQHEPTAPALEQENALLDDTWDRLLAAIADGRGVTKETAASWVDEGPWLARDAHAAGLVDALIWSDQLDELVDAVAHADVEPYDVARRPRFGVTGWESPSQIGVVYVEGAIVAGPSQPGGLFSGPVSGSATVVEQLLQAKDDPQVRAVVVRVDSPGGSVFASEEIHRAIALVREIKPVVVSMGAVAASGGYYVAAGATSIWAESTTVTGSIGVYSGKTSWTPLLERLGVTTVPLSRGRAAGMNGTDAWDAVERARVEREVMAYYQQFKDRVAEGRGMAPEDVERWAQGRVWSGRRAQEVGLVDEIGGLQDAIQDARRRAGIPDGREIGIVTWSWRGPILEALTAGEVRAGLSPRAPDPRIGSARALQTSVAAWSTLAGLAEEGVWYLDPDWMFTRRGP